MIPDEVNIPNIVYPISYVCFVSIMVSKFQRHQIQEHVQDGGETYRMWRALLVGLISFIILVIIALIVLLLTS